MTETKKKYILFSLGESELWGLPLEEVARVRAEYYADKGTYTTYQEEFNYVMGDLHEGQDWFFNNQDPEDFKGKYIQLRTRVEPPFFTRIKHAIEVSTGEVTEPVMDYRARA